MKDLVARIKQLRIVRAWQRYSSHNGNLVAGGIAYHGFFSVIPAIALGFTIFGIFLRGNPQMLQSIGESLNTTLPGLVATNDNPGAPIKLSTPQPATLTVTGIVALLVLLNSGLGWVGATRTGIRSLFGLDASPDNAVLTKLRDLGTLTTLGLGIALSAVLTSALGGFTASLAEAIGLGGLPWLVTLIGLAIGGFFDFLLMMVLIRMLTGIRLPWANVRAGAIVGAVLLTVVKYFGAMLIKMATGNPLFAAMGVAVALLFWLYLMSRIVLLSAAWAANDTDDLTEKDQLARGKKAEEARARAAAVAGVAAAGHGSHSGVAGGTRAEQVGAPSPAALATARAARDGSADRVSTAQREEDAQDLAKAIGGLVGAAILVKLLHRNRAD